jgi:integrase
MPGSHYDAGSYRQAVQRGCRKAGVPVWHPHQLRHNYATMIRREYGLDVAQVLLGHASINATQIYAEVNIVKARSAAEVVG